MNHRSIEAEVDVILPHAVQDYGDTPRQRKRHDIGLGSAGFVTLAEARELAEEIRGHAKGGGDVAIFVRQRRDQSAGVMTVERAATLHFEEAGEGKAARTRDMRQSRMKAYVRGDLLERRRDLMNIWSAFVIDTPKSIESQGE